MMMECDTLLMIGSGFPYSEFLPKEGKARGVQIDHRARHAVAALSDGGQSRRRCRGDAARAAAACSKQKERRHLAQEHRRRTSTTWWKTLEERAHGAGQSGQSAARTWELSPRLPDRRHHHQRFRLLRQLVCPRSEDAPRHDGFAVRRPGVDGRGRALRHRRQIRASRPPGDRAGRRRRHADEQHGRTDHGREILAAMGRSALDRLRLQQRGSQPGDLGTAGDGGRSRNSTPRRKFPMCRITASPS